MTDFIEENSNLSSVSNPPLVAILLCTYNGARFLAEQLDSLEGQTHQNWVVFASDDGSTDQTLEILRQYQEKWLAGKLTIRSGPQKGFCQNFLSLACDPEIKADYYAFCDQDDVWLPKKLQVGIHDLDSVAKPEVPHVYCGRTAYVRDDLKVYCYSPEFKFPRTFRNALVQSIAGGNTMVFNQATKNLLQDIGLVPTPSHDWWLYQIVTGVGGVVHYDSTPQILYRQHSGALVGGNTSIWSRIERIRMVFQGRFKAWSEKNIECLTMANAFLNESSVEILELFKIMRKANIKDRFRLMEVCGLYRQTWRGTLSLILAAAIKKI